MPVPDPQGERALPELNPRLAAREKIFRAPPLTAELCAAIKLISPQFDLAPDEECRRFWEADQNGSCWGEYEALRSLFEALPKPGKALEIGPGLGRSAVFFTKKLGWQNVEFHLYEGAGSTAQYTTLGPRSSDSFCGSPKSLQHCLDYNGIENAKLFDAISLGGKLSRLPGPYDLIYGFYSIGFHWALEHFFDEILALSDERTLAVFTVPPHFEPFEDLRRLHFRVLTWRTVWPKDWELKLLAFSRSPLPGS